MSDREAIRVVVIGGGISGLATAYRVREALSGGERPFDLTVLEAADRPGGTIRTFGEGGFRVESGPNGFLDGKPGTLRLARDLGLEASLVAADHSAKKRYLFIGGKQLMLPTSPLRFMTSPVLPLKGRARVMLEPLMPRGPEDESVADFGRRRLGRHAVARLLDPMVSGVFAGDVEKLSVASAFPSVKALELEHGSLVRGMLVKARERRRRAAREGSTDSPAGGPTGPAGHLRSFEGGMSELVDSLSADLGGALRANTEVSAVRPLPGGGWAVDTCANRTLEAEIVICAAPAYTTSRLLEPLGPSLARDLEEIPYAPITVVAVGLREERLRAPLDGFGFLVPSGEREKMLGCLWCSSIYPGRRAPAGHVLTRAMIGGAHRPELALLGDDELVAIVREAHRRMMGVSWDEPDYLRVMRYEKGIPQYPVGHLGRLSRIASACESSPGLFLTGNHLRGIGVNDCAADAEATATAVAGYATSCRYARGASLAAGR